MIIRTKLSENEARRRKIKALKGKKAKDKVLTLIKDIVELLEKINKLNRYPSASSDLLTRVLSDLSGSNITTSDENKLDELMICFEDTEQLLDDMVHQQSEATYAARLNNVLNYLKSFPSQKYVKEVIFYDEISDRIDDQIKAVSRDIQYHLSKLQYTRKQLVEEVAHLESSNIELAKALKALNKEKIEYAEKARTIQDQHDRIEFNKGTIELLRKKVKSYQMLVNLLNQLAVLDTHHKHLKADGYTRKLIARLYRKPEELDILENSADLVQVIEDIKSEIIQIESIVSPVKKMVFKDVEDPIDEDIILKYAQMED